MPPKDTEPKAEENPEEAAKFTPPLEETSTEKVDLGLHLQEPEFREAEIQNREQKLLNLGISQETIDKIRQKQPTLVDIKQAEDNLKHLQQQGFSDPVKLIENCHLY